MSTSEQRARLGLVGDPETALFGSAQHPGDQPVKVLVSFWYYRTTDLDQLVADLTTAAGPPMVFADCGAFSAKSLGVEVDLAEYAQWVHRWRHLFAAYVNLDVIGDREATAVNQARMEDEFDLAPVPVVHGGTDVRYVEELCERHPYVALGGMVARDPVVLRRWLAACFLVGRRTGAVFHGFGQTRIDIIRDFPWYSVDSSSWGGGHRYGQLPWWDPRAQRLRAIALGQPVPANAAQQLRQAGIPVAAVNDRDRYHHLYACRASAWAWWQLEAYLRRRHGAITPPRMRSLPAGLHLYLVDGQATNLRGMLL